MYFWNAALVSIEYFFKKKNIFKNLQTPDF